MILYCTVLVRFIGGHIFMLCLANKHKDWQKKEKDWGEVSDHVFTCAKDTVISGERWKREGCSCGWGCGCWSGTDPVNVRVHVRAEGDKHWFVGLGDRVDPTLVSGDSGVYARNSRQGAALTKTHNSALHPFRVRHTHHWAPWISLRKERDGSIFIADAWIQ